MHQNTPFLRKKTKIFWGGAQLSLQAPFLWGEDIPSYAPPLKCLHYILATPLYVDDIFRSRELL